jgi:hypothetical protein
VFCALEASGRVLLEHELALCIADADPVTPGHSLGIARRICPMGWRCTSRNGTRWWMRAVDPETRSGGLERFDGVQHAPKSLFGQLQIMAGLHPQPEAFAEAEETAQRSR